jgi:hypothetical protein
MSTTQTLIKANWLTYDINLDSWTKEYLGENPKNTALMKDTPLASKYNSDLHTPKHLKK